MTESLKLISYPEIGNRIFTIRGVQVMIDFHLAELYQVETKRLNEQVKRNHSRFPESFMLQLTQAEWNDLQSQNATQNVDPTLRSQNATLKNRGAHRKYLPYAFTEQGVAMLSAVLNSQTAIEASIKIMDAFVKMRKIIYGNALLNQRLDRMEYKLFETDHKFEQVFKALESKDTLPKQGVFFDGQIFDAYTFVSELIRSATKSIQLIDNYIDDSVLMLLSKRDSSVAATIYTKNITKILEQDIRKFNAQYPPVSVKKFDQSHDRFLIIDETRIYLFGASLKDLGKKWFGFSQIDKNAVTILQKIKDV